MPTRNRPAITAPAEVIEQEEAEDELPGLQFNEPLSWRAGKPIPVAELLRRLQALARELKAMDQEEHDRSTFNKVAKELASPNLLTHKDKGVRAWTACSLVDILRLCAPDAPFTGTQLRDIFSLLVKSILPALSDPSNAYNSQHIYVLQSLSTIKSIVLLTDIPQSENLILDLFTSFFDITSGSTKSSTGEQLGKNVEHEMAAILVVLVDESTSLPSEVVDIIVAQFLRADPRVVSGNSSKNKKNGVVPVADERQSTLLMKELPPAYNMAKDICNSCPEKMTRYVSQYFNDVILDASSSTVTDGTAKRHSHRRASNDHADSDEEDLPSGPSDDDLRELHKAHRLLRELWRASPPVLQNVIPQLQAELSAENVQLRLLAVETLGDIVSGIGAAGPPAPPVMDPSTYPTASLSNAPDSLNTNNILTTPLSPQPFSQAHPTAYANLLGRKKDKSPVIRSAWTTAIGRILMTSAGGIGLSAHEEETLVTYLAGMLVDGDEKVRFAATKAVASFGFSDVINKLGSIGGISKPDSVLANLADRARDRKHGVRVAGMNTLARIWGVAAGETAAGNEIVSSILGAAPSKIYDAFYANDLDIFVLLDHVSFELLLPISFPPIKLKGSKVTGGDSQRVKDSQTNGDAHPDSLDADKIRTARILHLVKDLDPKAKKAFYAMQARQVNVAKIMTAFLKRCEEYNGGVMDENEADIKSHLTKLVEWFSKSMPDPVKVSTDLWKFAKMHDRRSYQLVKFCMAPESDYRTVQKAIKELTKRIENAPGNPVGLLDTITPLLYRVTLLVYNKSHVPAIVEYSRTDENGLASTAHEVLKEISTQTPEVFKVHVQELCKVLEEQAPSKDESNEPGAVDTLKACAGFAQKFPKDIPRERRFLEALTNFAMYGTPPAAAKHAITIIMATAEKKEMYAKDLLQKTIKNFEFGSSHFLARLAALSQLMLLAPKQVHEEGEAVTDIAINQVLVQVRKPAGSEPQPEWEDDVDDECKAKIWALKILVNQLRSNEPDGIPVIQASVYKLLDRLIQEEGELSIRKDTPASHKSHLRLTAARLYLKVCVKKPYDELLTPTSFNHLATVAQDSHYPVRLSFLTQLKKYLGQNRLSHRFYAIVFLLAFEPADDLREDTLTWIRARSQFFALHKSTSMETLFARLLSLLAHHPDYSNTPEDLADFTKYILFYLNPVANAENLGLIYHIAQRVKQTRDAIDPSTSENLYYLSDLAQAVIRRYEEVHSWSMQTWPGKIGLPNTLFAKLPSHKVAQEIADKLWLPDEVVDRMDELVRVKAKTKKRKSDAHDDNQTKKKAKSSTAAPKQKSLPIRKTTKPKTPKARKTKEVDPVPSSERRRSGRAAGKGKVYAEKDDEEDDHDMQMWNQPDKDDEANVAEEEEEVEEKAKPKAGTKMVNGKNGKVEGGKEEATEVVSDDDNNEDDDDELSDPPDLD
ncbi:MAG: hypothetical protein M1835_007003 [Candelina submexicana]|nr:MAG: hypothetical protein M1835_007003 [Candelina submexicana]